MCNGIFLRNLRALLASSIKLKVWMYSQILFCSANIKMLNNLFLSHSHKKDREIERGSPFWRAIQYFNASITQKNLTKVFFVLCCECCEACTFLVDYTTLRDYLFCLIIFYLLNVFNYLLISRNVPLLATQVPNEVARYSFFPHGVLEDLGDPSSERKKSWRRRYSNPGHPMQRRECYLLDNRDYKLLVLKIQNQ